MGECLTDLCWLETHVDFPLCIDEGRGIHQNPARLQFEDRILRRIFFTGVGVWGLGFSV